MANIERLSDTYTTGNLTKFIHNINNQREEGGSVRFLVTWMKCGWKKKKKEAS